MNFKSGYDWWTSRYHYQQCQVSSLTKQTTEIMVNVVLSRSRDQNRQKLKHLPDTLTFCSMFPVKVNKSFKYDTDQTKLPLGWWSCTMGFSKNWKALGIVLVVLFPYFTVTVRKSDGTLSVRYSPVLQVISLPKCSLSRQGHKSTLAGVLFFFLGGGNGVHTRSLCSGSSQGSSLTAC